MRCRAALIALQFAGVFLLACAPEPATRFRVTLVGVDGADWRVIDPLLENGELPNFAGLIAGGVRGPFRSELPLNSPPIWTTVATGVSRERHGIWSFRNGGQLVSSRDRRVPALWTIASSRGLRSAVIGWWGSYPAEPIEGVVITERALKTRDADITAMFRGKLDDPDPQRLTYPPEVLGMLDAVFARERGPDPDDPEPVKVKINMRIEDQACIEALLWLRDERGPFDLEMVLLRGTDPVSHFFWRFHEPNAEVYRKRPSPENVKRHGDTVRDHYRFVDGLLGELRRHDPDRVILIVSDHGFEAGRQRFRLGTLTGTHKTEATRTGIFVANGGPIVRGTRIDDVGIYDVVPLLLYLLDLEVAEDLEGKIPVGLLDAGFEASRPPRRIDHYDLPASTLPGAAEPDTASPVDEQLLDELKALGYIDPT